MTDGIRVLIVDDDFRVAGLHGEIVGRHPAFTVVGTAGTAAAARDLARRERPDLALVDVYLPDGDGIELLRELSVDGFVVSAASDGASVRRGIRSGALAYLLKPFEARFLLDRLDAYQRFRNVLPDDRPTEQEAIERAFRILHSGDAGGAPSRATTEQLVLAQLGEEELSAAQIAERTGVSRATAQRYLAALAARGLAEVGLRYGTTGRPEHRYRRA